MKDWTEQELEKLTPQRLQSLKRSLKYYEPPGRLKLGERQKLKQIKMEQVLKIEAELKRREV